MIPTVRVYAYPAPVDLRLAYEGLTELAGKHLARVAVGACFLFVNAPRTRAKVLHVDGTGTCIYAKRLDGNRQFPQLWADDADGARPGEPIRLTWHELLLFIRHTPVVPGASRALTIIAGTGRRRPPASTRRRQRAA